MVTFPQKKKKKKVGCGYMQELKYFFVRKCCLKYHCIF